MEDITRRQALGGMAVAMAGLLAGRAALGADAASSQAGDAALDAKVSMGNLTVAYPSAWTKEEGDSTVLLKPFENCALIISQPVSMPGNLNDETVNEALDAHINGAVRGMDSGAHGDKARADRDGIVRSSCPLVGTVKGVNLIGFAYAILDGTHAYTMQFMCESARINEVFATMQRIWESASLPAATPAEQPAPAEPAAFDPGTYLDPGYDALARTPDDFKDQKVYVGGKILQVQEDTSGTTYRIAQNSDYGSVVMAYADAAALGGSRLLEDDIVDLYGVYKGLYTYKAVLGQSVTVPLIKADKIILQSENV